MTRSNDSHENKSLGSSSRKFCLLTINLSHQLGQEWRKEMDVVFCTSPLICYFSLGKLCCRPWHSWGGGALSAVPLGVDCGLVVSTDLPTVQNLELTTVNPDYYQIPFLLNKHHMNVSSSKSKQWVVFEL